MPQKKKNAGTVNNEMLVAVTNLSKALLEMTHHKGNATSTKKGKGKKKPRVLLNEAQKAELKGIKDGAKEEGIKYSERRKLVRNYLKGIKEAQRAALGLPPGAAIPRQPRAPKPEYNGEDKEFIQAINNGTGTRAEKNRKIREYQDVIRPYRGVYVRKPRSAQAPAVVKAVAKVNAAEEKVDALHQEMNSALTPAEVKVVGKQLEEALEEKAAAAADAAAVAENEGDDETAEDMKNVEADAVTEGNQLPDAVQDAVTKSQYRSPSFGAGLGRRAMLSRWG